LGVPLDSKIKELPQVPYTISYVIRKLQQIENLHELPKEKRPTEEIIWDGTSEELEDWLDKVLNNKIQKDVSILIKENEVEG
jgi:hypothetical protein